MKSNTKASKKFPKLLVTILLIIVAGLATLLSFSPKPAEPQVSEATVQQFQKYEVKFYSGTATIGGGVGTHDVLYVLTVGSDAHTVTIEALDNSFQLALNFQDRIPESRQDFVFGKGADIVFQVGGREIGGNFTEVKFAPDMQKGVIEIALGYDGNWTIITVTLPANAELEDTDKLA